ncbi:HAD family hydrolase [Kytococcus schroeteri]|uniref:HAD family hydrolase n=1 Tax=Kytococcus schroeteri TaxID=138300 RepID=UPI00114339A2|nr:HAD family hydrolase [Kytococcus schroeteri]
MTVFTVQGVVFDLDDTLMPEREYVASGYAAVARRLTGELSTPAAELERQLWEIFDSQDRGRAYDALLALHGREDRDLITECVRTYREHTPTVRLSAAARDVLGHCLARGPVGIVTDGPEVMQAAKARALGLEAMGVHVVLSDALGGREAWKPSPRGMLEVLQRMGVSPEVAVYVGDNPTKDFLAARAAGMHSIRYRQRGQLHADSEPAPGAQPDAEISSLTDLPSVLQWATAKRL